MLSQAEIKPWGNSQGIRLNKEILAAAKMGLSDVVQIEASEGMVILRKIPKHKTFRDRLAAYNGEIEVCDFDWGEPVGREML